MKNFLEYKFWIPAVLAITLVAISSSFSSQSSVTDEQIERADALIAEVLTTDGGPGLQAAVMIDGTLVWSQAVGMADLENPREMTRDTRLRIGSVSKTFTAALVARLIEMGKMDDNEAITIYVPEYQNTDVPITLRHLASHTSGIRHYDFMNYLEANNIYYFENLMDAFTPFLSEPLLHAPGEAFSYTSFGFNLLGIAAERAAGEPFLAALEENVLKPLNLEHTSGDHPLNIIPGRSGFYAVTGEGAMVPSRSHFYEVPNEGAVINTLWRDSSDYYPSGGMLSTAEDLAAFATKVFGEEALGKTATSLIKTPIPLNDGSESGYTFGWQVKLDENGEVLWYGHNGETNGGYATVRYFPKTKMAVAGVTNYTFIFHKEPCFFEAISKNLPGIFSAGPIIGQGWCDQHEDGEHKHFT